MLWIELHLLLVRHLLTKVIPKTIANDLVTSSERVEGVDETPATGEGSASRDERATEGANSLFFRRWFHALRIGCRRIDFHLFASSRSSL